MITCPVCNRQYTCELLTPESVLRYCPCCGNLLNPPDKQPLPKDEPATPLVADTPPARTSIQFNIGSYEVLAEIGRGGMGEVYKAFDTTCGRFLAIKRIRPDLSSHEQILRRFLKEARVTSQLTHPAIIPIYAIGKDGALAYYTMPYVEGSTLKQLFRQLKRDEKEARKPDIFSGTIPSLMRHFLSICQAIAYAHSKQVLHRDIKPENIIIGKYGEVFILDWGLAKIIRSGPQPHSDDTQEELENESSSMHHITRLGKVVGTVSYMAPERALGKPADVRTDVYSLGVILYQILTLKLPFQRGTLKEFCKQMATEKLIDPAEIAPYRDVPKMLARIAVKCLQPNPTSRYQSVAELIKDLEIYVEGRSEWSEIATLDIHNREDWEFQENVLIAEHTAITRNLDISDWVSLMISKLSFDETLTLETEVRIGDKGQGIGFLLSIPEVGERLHLNDGYSLWLGSDLFKSTKILRSSVEVMHAPEVVLQRHEWHKIRIEKRDSGIQVYINGQLQLSYVSYLPVTGTHIGFLCRDANFQIKPFTISVGNQSVMVNCLAVPDAFLAHRDYIMALAEYRRIGYSFPGRAEGRQAMFKAGITLLEQGKGESDEEKKRALFDEALQEFEKLHNTPGAPLEYLGKAIVYSTLKDFDEEIKCFELAYRRYPKHPLLPILQEQIIYRMHESSRNNRKVTFNFMLLAACHLPGIWNSLNTRKLFSSLIKHWEPLPFFHNLSTSAPALQQNASFALKLAFWLAKPYVLKEIYETSPSPDLTGDALYALIELGLWKTAREKIDEAPHKLTEEEIGLLAPKFDMLEICLACHEGTPQAAFHKLLQKPVNTWGFDGWRALCYIFDRALIREDLFLIHYMVGEIPQNALDTNQRLTITSYAIWAALWERDLQTAGELFNRYPIEIVADEMHLMHFLYGIWLLLTEGKDIAHIHFSGVLEVSYPRSWMLFSHFFNGKLSENSSWYSKAFLWEKRQLYKQLTLYYRCTDNTQLEAHYKAAMLAEFLKP